MHVNDTYFFHILMLIKRRPSQFTSFVETNMNILLNLYIAGQILCDRHLLLLHSMRFLHSLIRSLGLYPTPSWNTLPLFNQLVFKFGKCGSWKGIQSCIHRPRIPQGWPIGDGSGTGRPVKGVCHDQLANSSLPY